MAVYWVYCEHESDEQAQHLGHQEHSHAGSLSMDEAATADDSTTSTAGGVDCGHCHSSCCSVTALTKLPPQLAVMPYPVAEAAALNARREAAQAQQQVAQSWTAEPVAVELAGASDRLNRNLGAREFEVGLAVPLWLPGERDRSQAQAAALGRAVESHAIAAQLRLAASVREAWWNWQRARAETQSAAAQLSNAQRIAADVQQRLQAGDLARADMHQAEGQPACWHGLLRVEVVNEVADELGCCADTASAISCSLSDEDQAKE